MLGLLKKLLGGGVPRVDVATARDLLARGEAVLVDIREPGEIRASGKAQGALAIPMGQLRAKADPTLPGHDPALVPGRTVILYCASGTRSAFAGRTLQGLGYRDVRNLGSLADWRAGGGPIEPA